MVANHYLYDSKAMKWKAEALGNPVNQRGTYALNSDDVSIRGENLQSFKINVLEFTRLMFIEKMYPKQ